VSTDDQMSIEDRVRSATRAGASLIRDVRPLGAPAPARLRRRPGPAPRRWVNWGVPLAAAAAVAAIALTLVAVRQPPTSSPPVSGSSTAAPATVPRYYAYAAPVYNHRTGSGPLIVGDDLTGKVIDTVNPPAGLVFTSVQGTSDDRTFVARASIDTTPGGPPPYTWYLLRIAPGSAHPYQLTKLPIKLPVNTQASAYALSPDGRELAVGSMPGSDSGSGVTALRIYSVSTGAELRVWTAPGNMSPISDGTLTWLPGGRQLAFNVNVSTQGPVYHGQLRMLDVKSTGANLTADSRVLLTVGTTGATTCESLQITPDGKTAVCATQYYKAGAGSGTGTSAACANGGLKFTAFPLPATRPSRVLYQNRGACNNGDSFTLWTDPSASSIIGVTWINPHGAGGREAVQIGVITGGHFRPLNIATSVPPETYPNLAF
jgi:hypothetical protein